MKLSVKDRMIFGAFYPTEDSLEAMLIVRGIQERVEVPLAEKKRLNMRDEVPCPVCGRPSQVVWDEEEEKSFDVKFTRGEIDFLQAQVGRLSKNRKVTPVITDLCVRINKLVSEKEPEKKE